MGVGPDVSRDVTEAQFDEVEALLKVAFPTDAEARLVRRLRADGDMLVEVQKPWQGKIGGYLALSRMQAPLGWACLAPMAVRPEWQRGRLAENNPNMEVGAAQEEACRRPWRFGSRMLWELAALIDGATGEQEPRLPEAIVVLGEPSFYGCCGFSLARAQKLHSPYPLSHTLILKRGVDVPEEGLVYPAAFSKM
ncbi:GNAT family N-acetyltransferase [Pseudophaeobacter arcticus]|uniref:GNAT family N-acetyltransferase n=1 Tax=Pseudophaeobacter arcticus TaxID=385492 RepID=UPI00048871E5|nr:GNAT family acetyltransferase [Pseudophaeobacter arcticus]